MSLTSYFSNWVVRAVGIEPTLCHQNRILSPARLPVPPRPRDTTLVRKRTNKINLQRIKSFMPACTLSQDCLYARHRSRIAQLVEQATVNRSVVGSSPTSGARFYQYLPEYYCSSRIAQLVEQATVNRSVVGSSPTSGARFPPTYLHLSRRPRLRAAFAHALVQRHALSVGLRPCRPASRQKSACDRRR